MLGASWKYYRSTKRIARMNKAALGLWLVPLWLYTELGISEWLCIGCSALSIALTVTGFILYWRLPAGAQVEMNRYTRISDWESRKPGILMLALLLLLNLIGIIFLLAKIMLAD